MIDGAADTLCRVAGSEVRLGSYRPAQKRKVLTWWWISHAMRRAVLMLSASQ